MRPMGQTILNTSAPALPTRREPSMKHFRCGDVVPGCSAVFTGTEGQILSEIEVHARGVHGMASVPEHLVADVRAAMVEA